jgi:hypothetical protein
VRVVAVSFAELDGYADADFDRLPVGEIARFLRFAELAKRRIDSMLARAVPVFEPARLGPRHLHQHRDVAVGGVRHDRRAGSIVRTARLRLNTQVLSGFCRSWICPPTSCLRTSETR